MSRSFSLETLGPAQTRAYWWLAGGKFGYIIPTYSLCNVFLYCLLSPGKTVVPGDPLLRQVVYRASARYQRVSQPVLGSKLSEQQGPNLLEFIHSLRGLVGYILYGLYRDCIPPPSLLARGQEVRALNDYQHYFEVYLSHYTRNLGP